MNQLPGILRNPFKLLIAGFLVTILAVLIFTIQGGQTLLTQTLFVLGNLCTVVTAIMQIIIKVLLAKKV